MTFAGFLSLLWDKLSRSKLKPEGDPFVSVNARSKGSLSMSYQRQWHLNARINASHRRKRVRLLLVIPVCALNGLILTSIIALLLWAADISSSAALLASFAG